MAICCPIIISNQKCTFYKIHHSDFSLDTTAELHLCSRAIIFLKELVPDNDLIHPISDEALKFQQKIEQEALKLVKMSSKLSDAFQDQKTKESSRTIAGSDGYMTLGTGIAIIKVPGI